METLQQSSFGFSSCKMFSDSGSEDYALGHDNVVLTRTKMRAESEARCLDHWERILHVSVS